MPKIMEKKKPSKSLDSAILKIDFAKWGQAIVLSQLAEAKGMHVKDVAGFPHFLLEVGLPEKIEHWIIDQAHKLNRNAIDASLWRWNRPLTQRAPELSWKEARAEKETPPPVVKPVEIESEDRTEEPAERPGKKHRADIYGFAIKRVVMWMAKQSFETKQINAVLEHFGAKLAPTSISAFVKHWKKLGPVAALTSEQAKTINKIAGKK